MSAANLKSLVICHLEAKTNESGLRRPPVPWFLPLHICSRSSLTTHNRFRPGEKRISTWFPSYYGGVCVLLFLAPVPVAQPKKVQTHPESSQCVGRHVTSVPLFSSFFSFFFFLFFFCDWVSWTSLPATAASGTKVVVPQFYSRWDRSWRPLCPGSTPSCMHTDEMARLCFPSHVWKIRYWHIKNNLSFWHEA